MNIDELMFIIEILDIEQELKEDILEFLYYLKQEYEKPHVKQLKLFN